MESLLSSEQNFQLSRLVDYDVQLVEVCLYLLILVVHVNVHTCMCLCNVIWCVCIRVSVSASMSCLCACVYTAGNYTQWGCKIKL